MRAFVRVLVGLLLTSSSILSMVACSPGGAGAGADGGRSDGSLSDASKASCMSICTSKASQCMASSSQASTVCPELCATNPSQSELACIQSSDCSAILSSLNSGKLICAGDGSMMDQQDSGADATVNDGAAKKDGDMKDGAADSKNQDASDSSSDSPSDAADSGVCPSSCTVTLSGAMSGSLPCSALASYSPANGVLFTLDAPGGAGSPLIFGATLASSNDFTAGQTYNSTDMGAGTYFQGEGVWAFSPTTGDGSMNMTVLSPGRAETDDAGDGDIYFAGACGTLILDLAAKDAPFATGTVTATINWLTPFGFPGDAGPPHDGGSDASHPDASMDGSTDGSSNDGSPDKNCRVMLSGAETTTFPGLPCTSSATYLTTGPVTTLTIHGTSSGNQDTDISIAIPGQFSSLNGSRTSASTCAGTTSQCAAGASFTEGSGASAKGWARTWSMSDEGAAIPWFTFDVTANGTCTPITPLAPTVESCSGYVGTFTATLPSVVDGGATPLTLTVTGF